MNCYTSVMHTNNAHDCLQGALRRSELTKGHNQTNQQFVIIDKELALLPPHSFEEGVF